MSHTIALGHTRLSQLIAIQADTSALLIASIGNTITCECPMPLYVSSRQECSCSGPTWSWPGCIRGSPAEVVPY